MMKKSKTVNKDHSEAKKQETLVIPLSAVICIIVGFIFGSSIGSRFIQDSIDEFYGYRWNYLERCIINDGTFAGGYCRAPKECTCKDVTKIDELTVDEMTEELYTKKYAFTNRPVIIRNIATNWSAMNNVDYTWLKNQYTASPDILEEEAPNCFFRCYKTNEFKTLSDVFSMSQERFHDVVNNPWYVGWSVCQDKVFDALTEQVTLPRFLSRFDMIGNMWIFIGTPGYGAHLHLDDDLDTNTWQAQISGIKTWFLEPPPECAKVCTKSLQADMFPGDMIIVNTNFWMHKTHVLDHGISLVITQQIG